MKTKIWLFVIALAGIFSARAVQEQIPDTVGGIWAEIHRQQFALNNVIKFQHLDEVAQHTFAIREMSKALESKVPAERKSSVEGAVLGVANVLDEMEKSAKGQSQGVTEGNLQKLDDALKILQAQTEK